MIDSLREPLGIFLKVMTRSTLADYVSETMEMTPSKHVCSKMPERTISCKSFPPGTPQSTLESHAAVLAAPCRV